MRLLLPELTMLLLLLLPLLPPPLPLPLLLPPPPLPLELFTIYACWLKAAAVLQEQPLKLLPTTWPPPAPSPIASLVATCCCLQPHARSCSCRRCRRVT